MEEQIIRICMGCQKEFPDVNKSIKNAMKERTDVLFSHGYCKRHYVEMMKQSGFSDEQIQSTLKKLSNTFTPDLKEYPELVKQYSQGIFTPEDYKKAQSVTSPDNIKEFFQKRAGLIS